MVRLVTIRFSHYCEKARWGLDYSGVAYRESAHVPLFSWLPALRAGGRRTVPALVAGGERLSDSTDILRWADRQQRALYPVEHDAEVAAWEDDFDRGLGPAARRVVYHQLFSRPDMFGELLTSGGEPAWQRWLARTLEPAIRRLIGRGLRVDDSGAARSRAEVDRTFAAVAARLAEGRRYLVGERFTAADLTFAALSTLMILPPAFERFVLPAERLEPGLREIIERYRATPAGQFALRLYEARDAGPLARSSTSRGSPPGPSSTNPSRA